MTAMRPRFVDVLLLFALVFGIHVRGGIDTAVLLELGLVFLWLLRDGRLPVFFIALGALLVLALEYSVLLYVAMGGIDTYFPMRFTRATVALIAMSFVLGSMTARRRLRADQTWSYLGDIYLILMCIQSVVTYAEYMNPAFAQWMYVHWVNYPLERVSTLRALGLTTAAAMPSYLHVIGFYIAWDKLARGQSSFSRVTLCVMGVVSLAATFLMAQTGVILLLVSFLPFALLTPMKRLFRVVVYFGVILVLITVVAGWYWNNRIELADRQHIMGTIYAKTDFIQNYVFYGHVGNRSYDDLQTMYVLPTTLTQTIFGNSMGLWSNNPYDAVDQMRLRSDVGYVVDLGGIGVIGLVFAVSFYLAVLVTAIGLWLRRPPVPGSLVLVTMTLFFLVGHAKEVHLFARSGFELFMIILWAVLAPGALRASSPARVEQHSSAPAGDAALTPSLATERL